MIREASPPHSAEVKGRFEGQADSTEITARPEAATKGGILPLFCGLPHSLMTRKECNPVPEDTAGCHPGLDPGSTARSLIC